MDKIMGNRANLAVKLLSPTKATLCTHFYRAGSCAYAQKQKSKQFSDYYFTGSQSSWCDQA